jgi:lysophospholipase L1-like esterase
MDGVFAIPKPPPYTTQFWASDGFHPGPDGYREWVEFALGAVPEELLRRLVL